MVTFNDYDMSTIPQVNYVIICRNSKFMKNKWYPSQKCAQSLITSITLFIKHNKFPENHLRIQLGLNPKGDSQEKKLKASFKIKLKECCP